MSILALLFLATLFLAYSNGANDNFKGVATLFGSGTTDYKRAIAWATITTLAGSLCSIFLAEALVKNFSGRGQRTQRLHRETRKTKTYVSANSRCLLRLFVAEVTQ